MINKTGATYYKMLSSPIIMLLFTRLIVSHEFHNYIINKMPIQSLIF